jgi:hypothetical protein
VPISGKALIELSKLLIGYAIAKCVAPMQLLLEAMHFPAPVYLKNGGIW